MMRVFFCLNAPNTSFLKQMGEAELWIITRLLKKKETLLVLTKILLHFPIGNTLNPHPNKN